MDDWENPSSTPGSPTSARFSTDRPPPNTSHASDYSSDDEAAVDPEIIRDEPDDADEDEEEGEDLYNDNYMDDYRRMDEQGQYESVVVDDSMEDEKDLDQIMEDRRAAEVELDERDGIRATENRKHPILLHEQDDVSDAMKK